MTGFLRGVNPLAKMFGPLPVMAAVFLTEDLRVLAAFTLGTLVLLLVGALPGWRTSLALVLGVPVGVAVVAVSFGLWVDPAAVADTRTVLAFGPVELTRGGLAVGLVTGLRLAALVLLAMVSGLTTTGPEFVRASVQHLRVPYRVGYAALASMRFVPRFGRELEVIRSAHRVRGVAGGRGPVAGARRAGGYAVPLLASGIRHAERVSLSMESRAFGAAPTRTERHPVPLRVRDGVVLLAFWSACWAVPALVHG
ncbi:energy-coupling factor transport system permease protein [Sediminihabitans luteus]|uniref:Energy-coupling factor transport system permease protein n=1 Tax=Sediminihabitans luteus TaxID=1138585 RepID=A0A2M9CPQ9_9CELL|nr:energy-coupling factor transporter transmembrane component T [Sediminihabitans luteus]PJJ73881.1 energy-coupling factor transport system permease protein [Sediminihabitans luteus]GII98207.1 hypothetical protein Slu03_05850 [Sediminihabitans luteus]